MTRFNNFTDEELNAMEAAFCEEGLKYLVDEVRMEKEHRRIRRKEALNLLVDEMQKVRIRSEQYFK